MHREMCIYYGFSLPCLARDECRIPLKSKMNLFLTIVNGQKPLTIFKKISMLCTAEVLHIPLLPEIDFAKHLQHHGKCYSRCVI